MVRNELGYGKKSFDGNVRYYSIKKNVHGVRIHRIKKSIYDSIVKEGRHIQMDWAVNDHFNAYRLDQMRRQKAGDMFKRDNPAQAEKSEVVKVGLGKRIKAFFKKIFGSKKPVGFVGSVPKLKGGK